MNEIWVFLQGNTIAALLSILALGTMIGQLSIRGISLGSSAVLFVGLVFGHFGVVLPNDISTLGVVLFVYSVGLQAGPRFFKAFRSRGITFALLAIATLAAAALASVVAQVLLGIDPALGIGIFTGALTTTPGLAAAMESVNDPMVSVGYGVAYPFGVVGVVLFMQILPRLMGMDLAKISRDAQTQDSGPKVQARWFKLTNEQLVGKALGQILRDDDDHATIARVAHGDEVVTGLSTRVLQHNDLIKAVGTHSQLEKIELFFGPPVPDYQETLSQVSTFTVVVTKDKFVGKSLQELGIQEKYGIVVTRIFRLDNELTPMGITTLEFGDTIRIVGEKADCERFIAQLGDAERKLQETRFLPLMVGLALGVFLGLVAVPLPGGGSFSLGLAGGPLLVALVAGHFGRIGNWVFHVPNPAKIFIRELGLIMFLAGAGVKAGSGFLEVVQSQGISLLIAGVLVTLVPLTVAFYLGLKVFQFDAPTTLGALCGAMTSTPGLGAVTQAADSEYPAIAYATVYPVALIIVTLISKLLALVLMGLAA